MQAAMIKALPGHWSGPMGRDEVCKLCHKPIKPADIACALADPIAPGLIVAHAHHDCAHDEHPHQF